jgi:hypothetical protein
MLQQPSSRLAASAESTIKARNSKHEIRNKSKIQIFKCSKPFFDFGHWDIRICFEFRYSDFGFGSTLSGSGSASNFQLHPPACSPASFLPVITVSA